MEIAELISALQHQGIEVLPDEWTGFKIHITPDAPGQSTEIAVKLLELLKEEEHEIIPFLVKGGQI